MDPVVPARRAAAPLAALVAALAACAAPKSAGEAETAAHAAFLGRPDPAPLLQSCAATPAGRTGWRYHCGAAVAQVDDVFGETTEALVRQGVQMVGAAGAGAVAVSVERLPLGGERRSVNRVRVGVSGRVRAAGLVGVVPFGEDRQRLVWCVARAEAAPERCVQIVDALAWQPWRAPPVVAQANAPPDLAGRPVLVPLRCEAYAEPTGGYVGCTPVVWFRWHRAGRGDTPTSELEPAAVAPLEQGEPGPATERGHAVPSARVPRTARGAVTYDDSTRPCTVEGVEAICRKTERESTREIRFDAVARIRGETVEVECNFQGDSDDLPPVCEAMVLR